MPPSSSDAFTPGDLYDPEMAQEAAQIRTAIEPAIDGVPRFEIAILIALTTLFCEVCEEADVDPEAAFAQIADGVAAGAFEPVVTGFIHAASNVKH